MCLFTALMIAPVSAAFTAGINQSDSVEKCGCCCCVGACEMSLEKQSLDYCPCHVEEPEYPSDIPFEAQIQHEYNPKVELSEIKIDNAPVIQSDISHHNNFIDFIHDDTGPPVYIINSVFLI